MILSFRQKRQAEKGAIMLEVIAVLSLMGLMGTVLYRQIYQRNQELHNVQMASEIRLVNEGFSAWIQANAPVLYATCRMASVGTSVVQPCMLSSKSLGKGIAAFLPDGYFFDSTGNANYLNSSYVFSLFGYWRGAVGGGSQIPTYMGVVAPQDTVLPDGGANRDTWNFRRAARVAMLIGMDGGVFGPGITGEEFVGAVGTWSIPTDDVFAPPISLPEGAINTELPRYIAMTEFDIYQPEIDMPSIQLGLPEKWALATDSLHAFGAFSVGGIDKNCYAIRHRTTTWDGGRYEISNDDIEPVANCQPAFWVTTTADPESPELGQVHVLNDLNVGADPTGVNPPAMRLSSDGYIEFNATTTDYQDAAEPEINYLLDPAYTSVMNDVKLVSRGGARLSEILPNYILKDVQQFSRTGTVALPTCPRGYNPAVRVVPISWRDDPTELNVSGELGPFSVEGKTVDGGTTVTGTIDQTVAKPKQRMVGFGASCDPAYDPDPDELKACLGWTDVPDGSTFKRDDGGILDIYTYCVWTGTLDADGNIQFEIGSDTKAIPSSNRPENVDCTSKSEDKCRLEAKCYWTNDGEGGGSCISCAKLNSESDCEFNGCSWEDNTCK